MNKKGFTLVELMVVIAIMAVIMLIVVPNVTGMLKKIDDEKYQRFLSDVFLATEAYVQKNIENYPEIKEENNKIYVYYTELIESNYLKSTTYDPKNKKQVKEEDYTVEVYLNEDKEYKYKVYEEHYVPFASGSVVYFNPEIGNVCSIYAYNYNTGASNTGNKTGCMKWYTYKDNDDGTYQLILDHNTTASSRWSSTDNNNTNGDAVKARLALDTSTWDKNLNISLITADEVAEVTSNTIFNSSSASSSEYFYLDTNTITESPTCTSGNTTGCNYGWLYDRSSNYCTTFGCLNNSDSSSHHGYWTLTPVANPKQVAWSVSSGGYISGGIVSNESSIGVRPVITISKELLINDSTLVGAINRNASEILDSPTTFNSSDKSENSKLYRTNDNDGTTLYFRGKSVNNYVSFAGHMWRIIRVNGDKTTRIILDTDTGINSVWHNNGKSNTSIQNAISFYEWNNSDIKSNLTSWYNSNLIEYDSYIENGKYCIDTSIDSSNNGLYIFGAFARNLVKNGTINTVSSPSNECKVSEISTKIGLITLDEITFAGGFIDTTNKDFYLYNSSIGDEWWLTMSPAEFNLNSKYTYIGLSNAIYSINSSYLDYSSKVRPVINLSSDVVISSGTGTSLDPYIID